jgi:hypothetical protein
VLSLPFILLWHSLFLPAFQVVRVEPTANDGDAIPPNGIGEANDDTMDVENEMGEEFVCTSARVTGEKDIGRGIARQMLGKSVFRGTITKVNSCPA